MFSFIDTQFHRSVFYLDLPDIFQAIIFPEHLQMTTSDTHTNDCFLTCFYMCITRGASMLTFVIGSFFFWQYIDLVGFD